MRDGNVTSHITSCWDTSLPMNRSIDRRKQGEENSETESEAENEAESEAAFHTQLCNARQCNK